VRPLKKNEINILEQLSQVLPLYSNFELVGKVQCMYYEQFTGNANASTNNSKFMAKASKVNFPHDNT